MTEIQKDSESIEVSPFQEAFVLENFFVGANRVEVLSQMKEAMQNGVALMVLTGEEGSGKTMLCRVLEHEVSPLCEIIFFPRAIDSFEDVLQTVLTGLGLDAGNEMHGRNIDRTLDRVISLLLDESIDLLVIFDEAENIFLATLERIRKMLDLINESGARMHVIFSGRETFLENCDQLSICDFQSDDERHFSLSPLSETETADYLAKCAVRLTNVDAEKIFTDEVVSNIYSLAQGNFRTTNILGEESVKIHGDDTSFMVLLDSVKEADAGGKTHRYREIWTKLQKLLYSLPAPPSFSAYSRYLPWVGGAAGCILLGLLLFGSKEDEYVGQDINNVEQTEQLTTVPAMNEIDRNQEMEEPLSTETTGQRMEEIVLEEEAVPVQAEAVEQSPDQDIDRLPVSEELTVIGISEKNMAQKEDEVIENEAAETAQDIIASPEEMAGEVESVVLLRPSQDLRDLKKTPVLSTEPQVLRAQPQSKVHKVIVSKTLSTADKLYNERVLAGAGWKKSKKEDMYTVQLMALASKTAKENLKKMLVQENYRQEAGNFYIFEKSTTKNIFVFYGEYRNVETARLVQKSLPKFLLDHQPYALSIKGAIAKVRN
jgi:type II secretory pathway predicted ATPase ExeA/septal ring-binding cell division protein DamX